MNRPENTSEDSLAQALKVKLAPACKRLTVKILSHKCALRLTQETIYRRDGFARLHNYPTPSRDFADFFSSFEQWPDGGGRASHG